LFRYIAYIAVFLTIRELAWRFEGRTWVIMLPPVIMAAAEAAAGVAQAHAGFARGTYVNRNHFAGFLELSLPFAIAYSVMILGRRGSRPLPLRQALIACLAIATAALIVVGIVDSLSRMGFLASLAALMTLAMFSIRGSRRPLVALVTAAVIATAIWLPPDALIRRLTNLSAPGEISTVTRLNIWADTFRLIESYPVFGCGAGAYESAMHRYQTAAPLNTVDYAHNDYLQLLAELGIPGVVILGAGLFALVKKNIRDARRLSNSDARYLSIAALAAIVGILVHSAADFNLYIPANAFAVAWIAGIAARVQTGMASQDRPWKALRLPPVIETKAVGS
jgi:O-antigen ligase